jgi:cell division cycle 14
MKHYKFPAAAFIGYIRLCRPGSILGPQQFFLNDAQVDLFKLAKHSNIYNQIEQKVDLQLL